MSLDRCPRCNEQIGIVGRFFQYLGLDPHRCANDPSKDRILIDREGVAYLPRREVKLKALDTRPRPRDSAPS